MSKPKLSRFVALAVTTSLISVASPAFAQIDEIVTTAQKKSENLQDVPIAITAFDLEAIETNRIEGLEDIATFAPGVYTTQNPADPNGVRVNIRGVGAFDPQLGQDARVGIYQDGVYLGKTQGLAFDMPDLAQIDILKGPQGTLYGRNTTAGAVNLVSARPDPTDYSGKITAEYGNYNHMKFSGAMNMPLGEASALRVSGLYLSRDGWVENNGPGSDFGGEDKFAVRAAFGTELSESLRFDLAADYNKTEKEPLFYQSVGNSTALFTPAITPFNNGRQDEVTTSFAPEKGDATSKGITGIVTWDVADNHELKLTGAYREMDSSRFVTLIPTANPVIVNAITGTGGFAGGGFNAALSALPFAFGAVGQGGLLRPDFASAFNGNPPERGLFLSPPGGSPNLVGHEQYSFDLTYNGSFADGKVEYTGGAFYFNEKTGTGDVLPNFTNANDYLFVLGQFDPRLTAPNIRAYLTANGIPAGSQGPIPAAGILLGRLGAGDFTAFPLLQQLVGDRSSCGAGSVPMPANNFCIPTLSVGLASARQSASNTLFIDTNSFALYGQATWHVTDDLRITGGLRYTDENRDGRQQAISPFFIDNVDLTGQIIPANVGEFNDTKLDPAVTIEFDATDDILVYASYKESHRAGGFNNAAVGLPLPGTTASADFLFDREDLTAYEAGFKADFGDRVRVNAAAYYYDFKNKQTSFSLNPIISTERAIVNTDDEIYGFEIDGQFAIMDGLTARASYSYTDGEAGDTVNPNDPTDIRMFDELQGVPKNSYLIALDYNGQMAGKEVFGNVNYSHKDGILLVPEAGTRLPSNDTVNGRIGMNFDVSGGDQASIALWVANLFDEKNIVDRLGFNTFAYDVEVYAQPRSYGITAGYKF